MRTYTDCHVHSLLPNIRHAKSTIEENVVEAINKGLKTIAITNHGTSHFLYGIRKKDIKNIKTQIEELRVKYPQIEILMGVEGNIISLDGDTDLTKEITDLCDIILCGHHNGVIYKNFSSFWNFFVMNFFAKRLGWFKNRQLRINTNSVVRALDKYNIDILTHPGDKKIVIMEEIAKAAEKNKVLLEINNSHTHLNTSEIKVCSKYKVNFIINSDSHIKDTIGTYSSAVERAKEAGLDMSRIVNLEQ